MKIAVLDIPFFKSTKPDPQGQLTAAVEALNERIERDGLEVINVESICETTLFGTRQVGLRVWHRTT